jgi:hypothetical protein
MRRYFTSLEGVASVFALIVVVVVAPEQFKLLIAFVMGIPMVTRAIQAGTDRASRRGMTDSARGDTRAALRADSWKRMTVLVKFEAPRKPSKWTQGVLVRRPGGAYWRYFWKPWRARLEIPVADLYFLIPASCAGESWNFAVPTVEATEFRRLFAKGTTPGESEDR